VESEINVSEELQTNAVNRVRQETDRIVVTVLRRKLKLEHK
jgi:hypothetical protein